MRLSYAGMFEIRRGCVGRTIAKAVVVTLCGPRKSNVGSLLTVCTIVCAFCGCGIEHDVPLRYTPTTAVESFSRELQGRRFAVAHFADSRARKLIAKVGLVHTAVIHDDPSLFVSGAVVDVLKRAGLKADLLAETDLESSPSPAVPPGYDALIIGRIKVLDVTTSTGLMSIKGEGRVALEYAIISSNDVGETSPRWSDAVTGQSARSWPALQFNEFSSLIDDALGHCLQNLVKDLQSGVLQKAIRAGEK